MKKTPVLNMAVSSDHRWRMIKRTIGMAISKMVGIAIGKMITVKIGELSG